MRRDNKEKVPVYRIESCLETRRTRLVELRTGGMMVSRGRGGSKGRLWGDLGGFLTRRRDGAAFWVPSFINAERARMDLYSQGLPLHIITSRTPRGARTHFGLTV